jgi:ribonuclease D
MSSRRFANPILIYTPAAFAQMLDHLAATRFLALDTESDSLYSYYPKVCLIQISTNAAPPGASSAAALEQVTDYLVDPIRFPTIEPLGDLLADPTCEVVMHAAENDILMLQREYRFRFARIFDTQLAARILGWSRVGLAAILEEQFGVVSNKRMQRTNWGKRPLTPEQIAYAQMDTHYLPALRRLLTEQLETAGRWEEAQEAFQMLLQFYGAEGYEGPQAGDEMAAHDRSFWQMRETRAVPRAATGILEALWEWREAEAQRRNIPAFKVVGNQALADLAVAQPTTVEEIQAMRSLSRNERQRYGGALLQVLVQGKRRPLPPLPEPSLRPEQILEQDELARYDALRRWRSDTAEARGVTPDIIFTNETLVAIARCNPQTVAELQTLRAIGPWKARTYGPAILAVLAESCVQ